MVSWLITGGSGAFGNAFARFLLGHQETRRIVIYSRNEFRQFQMAQELKDLDKDSKLRFFIGDVRDKERLRRALNEIDICVHAAALKRIEVGAYNPLEMKKTNIDGSANLIEATQDAGVKKVVLLSSDKAFSPVSPYGMSKAYAEYLFLAANNTVGWHGPRYAVCRYGNIWGSTGSVVPIWKAMLASGIDTVPVTDPECTRFFMRIEEAVKLVLHTAQTMLGGEVNIPNLPAYALGDLAQAMQARMNVIGLPAYEKKHESMSEKLCSETARRMTVEELRREL